MNKIYEIWKYLKLSWNLNIYKEWFEIEKKKRKKKKEMWVSMKFGACFLILYTTIQNLMC